MKKITSSLLLSLSLPLFIASCSQTAHNQAVTLEQKASLAIDEDSLIEHIKTLSSDKFGGRAPGTEGETLTVNYLTEQFKQIGVSPGNGQSYTQAVPLVSLEVINKPVLRFDGNNGKSQVLQYASEQVIWSRKQINVSSINDTELVFVGYGIKAPERNWNDYANINVQGKTVVMLINDPGYATQDPALFNGNAMTYYGRWDYKLDEAAKQGAVGAIIIHDSKPAAYPWATVEASWTGPQFDLVRQDEGKGLAAIEGWISKDKAQILFANAGFDLDKQMQAAQKPGFRSINLNTRVTASVKNSKKTLDSQNVLAMIKGSEAPEEVIIYMAHWDHIGTDPNKQGDGIYNGALDNATGTAGLIEIAKAYQALPEGPKRSIVFMAVTAEEQGLLGSAYYAEHPIFPLKNTVAGINMDGLSHFGRAKDVTLVSQGFSQLDSYFIKHASAQNRIVVPDPTPEKGSFFRSDHFELSKKGVPTMYAKPGYDHREKGKAYGLAQAAKYTANDYHGPSDEYSSDWDLSGAIEDLQLYFLTGLEISQSGDWPKWNEGSQFKAKRDAQGR